MECPGVCRSMPARAHPRVGGSGLPAPAARDGFHQLPPQQRLGAGVQRHHIVQQRGATADRAGDVHDRWDRHLLDLGVSLQRVDHFESATQVANGERGEEGSPCFVQMIAAEVVDPCRQRQAEPLVPPSVRPVRASAAPSRSSMLTALMAVSLPRASKRVMSFRDGGRRGELIASVRAVSRRCGRGLPSTEHAARA